VTVAIAFQDLSNAFFFIVLMFGSIQVVSKMLEQTSRVSSSHQSKEKRLYKHMSEHFFEFN
jgi:hypothetical protein